MSRLSRNRVARTGTSRARSKPWRAASLSAAGNARLALVGTTSNTGPAASAGRMV